MIRANSPNPPVHRDIEKSRCARYRPAKLRTPFFAASLITASPAMTRISLLATARSLPASIAASAGRKPPVPTTATSTMSASASAAISHKTFFAGKNLRLVLKRSAQNVDLCFHRPDKLPPARWFACAPASSRCCSQRGRQSPSAPECRARLSTRFRQSSRSRPKRRRVYVSCNKQSLLPYSTAHELPVGDKKTRAAR